MKTKANQKDSFLIGDALGEQWDGISLSMMIYENKI